MKAAVEPGPSRPEVVGGLGGFAGLFALDMTRYRQAAARLLHRRRRHQDRASPGSWTGTTPSASTWSRWSSTTWSACGAEPLFLQDYIACGKVVPERIAAIVARHRRRLHAGRLRAGRRRDRRARRPDGRRRVRPGRAPASASSRPTRSSARSGSRPGDVVIAMALVRAALQRLLAGAPRAAAGPRRCRRPRSRSSDRARWARSCSSRPGSTPGTAWRWSRAAPRCTRFAHITGGGLAGNLARVLPRGLDAVVDRATWAPPPVFEPGRGHGPRSSRPRWSARSTAASA